MQTAGKIEGSDVYSKLSFMIVFSFAKPFDIEVLGKRSMVKSDVSNQALQFLGSTRNVKDFDIVLSSALC